MKHIKNEFNSVWDALENDPVKAENMRLRSELMTSITEKIKGKDEPQTVIAKQLGITQSRVSALLQGKIDQFRLDMLVNIACRLGLQISLKVA